MTKQKEIFFGEALEKRLMAGQRSRELKQEAERITLEEVELDESGSEKNRGGISRQQRINHEWRNTKLQARKLRLIECDYDERSLI